MNKPISPIGIPQTPLGGPGAPASRNARINQIGYARNQKTIAATRELAHAGMGTLARQIEDKVQPGFAAIVLDARPALRDASALKAKLAASTIKWGGEGNVFTLDKWKDFVSNEDNRTLKAFHEQNGSAALNGLDKPVVARRSVDAQRARVLGLMATRKSDTEH
jgi:hypothetical protein